MVAMCRLSDPILLFPWWSWITDPCCCMLLGLGAEVSGFLCLNKIRGGGYSTLVWVGVCRWDFWNATHPCTHFEGKVTHPCTKKQKFSLKFAPFWRKFRKILKSWPIKVPNLRHFGANFRKFWKIDPSKYHVFEKKRDPLMYLTAWFCYPCLRHIPITTFVLSTPREQNRLFLLKIWIYRAFRPTMKILANNWHGGRHLTNFVSLVFLIIQLHDNQ